MSYTVIYLLVFCRNRADENEEWFIANPWQILYANSVIIMTLSWALFCTWVLT